MTFYLHLPSSYLVADDEKDIFGDLAVDLCYGRLSFHQFYCLSKRVALD